METLNILFKFTNAPNSADVAHFFQANSNILTETIVQNIKIKNGINDFMQNIQKEKQ